MSMNSHFTGRSVTVKKPSEIDTSFLPVGTTYRLPLGDFEAPCDVLSHTDLPSRLYLGTLDPGSFQKTCSGWTVRYADKTPDTYVDLEYKVSRNLLTARFVWQGVEGMSTCSKGSDWESLVRQMSLVFPESWEDKAKESLESQYNVRFVARNEDVPVITGFPDGAFQVLIFPVHTDRLHELIGCLNAMDRDAAIAAVVSIYVVMTPARIDYVEGRCPDVPDFPQALAEHNRNAVGLACNGLPEARTVAGGLRINAVHRWVYLVHVSCVFRDLERVIAHCYRQGFIGRPGATCAPSQYPDGMEWAALLMPVGLESQSISIDFYDEGPTRRVAYGRLLAPERIPLIVSVRDISREDALRRILLVKASLLAEPVIFRPDTLLH